MLAVLGAYAILVSFLDLSAWGQIAFLLAILLAVWWLFPEARKEIREFLEALGTAVRGR